MLALPLSILALASGVYLLVKVKREFLGGIFEILAWLVIVLSLVSVGFVAFKSINRCGGHCGNREECKIEKRIIVNEGESHCKMNNGCSMSGCKMEGDSCVMDKEVCEKMMGKEACDEMCKERGRCIMSKEECMKVCHTAGKSCCAEKGEPSGCAMHQGACKGDCGGKCGSSCGGKCESGSKNCCAADAPKKKCCKHKI